MEQKRRTDRLSEWGRYKTRDFASKNGCAYRLEPWLGPDGVEDQPVAEGRDEAHGVEDQSNQPPPVTSALNRDWFIFRCIFLQT